MYDDFAGFLRILACLYTKIGQRLEAECQRAGLEFDGEYWEEAARQTERARAIWQEEADFAQWRAMKRLRASGLERFAEALMAEDYLSLIFESSP